MSTGSFKRRNEMEYVLIMKNMYRKIINDPMQRCYQPKVEYFGIINHSVIKKCFISYDTVAV